MLEELPCAVAGRLATRGVGHCPLGIGQGLHLRVQGGGPGWWWSQRFDGGRDSSATWWSWSQGWRDNWGAASSGCGFAVTLVAVHIRF